MDPRPYLIAALVAGILPAFAWVAFWNDMVPRVFYGWTWAGHESWLGLVILAGVIGGPLALWAMSLKR